ncbi:dienelactone hydrolase family protein [Amycolatopsis methanolica]|uniref:Dienelactone hydrolase-like enzyme n=1 Tax=Amycolatopsis methanolica 239 TaxID=1068978 RepID=A0A076MKJ4_AMYME|nr:dienelactone hydrolase family protein [Amycolatopsis methanolica]AIJ21254.1 dienelactone hydrolase-like enzyme [Amycolatopsis methanolica 239]
MTQDIETSRLTVNGLNAYLARPAGGSESGMLLLPMVTGIGEQLREWAGAIAAIGVTALVWDPFHGPSSDDTSMPDLLAKMPELDDAIALDEQTQLLDHLLGELGCVKAGVIGWCLGGRFALILGGKDHRVANVVAYHPTVPGETPPNHTMDAIAHAGLIKAPVMTMYPTADELVPRSRFDELQSALQARDTGPSLIHVYPAAEHGFANKTRHGEPVNAEAFAISWPQVLEFIRVTTKTCL